MAKVDEIEERLNKRITHVIAGAWAVVIILLAWLGTGTTYIISMHGDIQAIKQYEKDHGGEIVRNIENPKSTAQLAANLSLAAAQVQVARAENRKPDVSKLKPLQKAVEKAIAGHPELPETWQASVQLVDYKYQAEPKSISSLPNCLDTLSSSKGEVDRLELSGGSVDYPNFSGPQMPVWVSHVFLGNCSLNLDDDGGFASTSVGKFFDEVKKHHPQASQFFIVINNAHITYSGGKMLPVSGIQFSDCTFEFRQPIELPDRRTQALITQLLAANPTKGTIQIPAV